MENRGKRATKNHIQHAFVVVFTGFVRHLSVFFDAFDLRRDRVVCRYWFLENLSGIETDSNAQYTLCEKTFFEFGGGDSGIRTPDLRIMMKIDSIFLNKINELQAPNPAV